MRALVFALLAVVVLVGCGRRESGARVKASPRIAYPPLDASPPPRMPGESESAEVSAKTDQNDGWIERVEDSWMERQVSIQEQIRGLREYAAQADPDDPFALTEAEIDALAENVDSRIH